MRSGPARGSTLKVRAPLPLCSPADPIEIHEASVEDVHRHCALPVVTWIVRSPPVASTDSLVEERRNSHGRAACDSCRRWSSIATALARGTGSAFAATVNWTEPSPCPLVGDASDTQAASLFADHVHSRVVSTRIVPVPPSGLNETCSEAACTWHFGCDGPVMFVSDVEPQAVNMSRGPRSVNPAAACRSVAVAKIASDMSGVRGRAVTPAPLRRMGKQDPCARSLGSSILDTRPAGTGRQPCVVSVPIRRER